ncbi:hypothetical protein EB155_13200 [archaeon]|nr:hypothetical protein [archaeon]NDB80810.1 hypothetical protein [archaeon]
MNTFSINAQVSTGHMNYINTLEWSPNGELLLSGATDQSAKIWKTDGDLFETKKSYQGPNGSVLDVEWIDNERFLTADANQLVFGWEINSMDPIYEFNRHNGFVKAISFDPSSSNVSEPRVVSGGDGSNVFDYNLLAGDDLFDINNIIRDHDQVKRITTINFSGDGNRIIIGGEDGYFRIYDVSGININLLGSKNLEEKIFSSDIDFNGDRVIISGETGVYSFEITEFGVPVEIGSKLELNCMNVCLNTDIKFDQNNSKVAFAIDNSILIYEWDENLGIDEKLLEIQTTSLGFEDSVKTYSIDWHPNGEKIAFGLGANIYVSDLLGQNTLFSQGELPQENNAIFYIGSGIVVLIVMIIITRMVIQTFRK